MGLQVILVNSNHALINPTRSMSCTRRASLLRTWLLIAFSVVHLFFLLIIWTNRSINVVHLYWHKVSVYSRGSSILLLPFSLRVVWVKQNEAVSRSNSQTVSHQLEITIKQIKELTWLFLRDFKQKGLCLLDTKRHYENVHVIWWNFYDVKASTHLSSFLKQDDAFLI